ncbi:hypothetical protein PMAYCL1PPCAC_14054, partial [Pristionchus mayeri]
LDPNQPYYVGYRLKPYLEQGYNSGGGGYLLSRKALEIYMRNGYNNETLCPDNKNEDLAIGMCLANLGIYPHPTINENGQQRFNGYHPSMTLDGWDQAETWIYDLLVSGFDGISRDLISFHHLEPVEMQLFEILLYRVKVNG